MGLGLAALVGRQVLAAVALRFVSRHGGLRQGSAGPERPDRRNIYRALNACFQCGTENIVGPLHIDCLHPVDEGLVGAKFIDAGIVKHHIGPCHRVSQTRPPRHITRHEGDAAVRHCTSGEPS